MGAILALGGLAEIVARAADLTILGYVWPVGLGVGGLMFFFHTQHGDDEAARKAVTIQPDSRWQHPPGGRCPGDRGGDQG